MKILSVSAAIGALILIQGCAFTEATLKVANTASAHPVGPISEAPPVQFQTPHFTDARPDKMRIGWKKNGYGAQTANIKTADPVEKIVEDAVAKTLQDNRHTVGPAGRVQVVGTVDRFWFEVDVNFWTVKFIGDVQCTLDFIDSKTNQSFYKSSYSGNYSEEKGGGLEKTWTIVMNKAVDKVAEDIALDDKLAAALRKLK